ncbi:MAG TPA: YpiB family protein [Bacillota bacterium]|nr:YpiB family protein [Bacillota bacterium]
MSRKAVSSWAKKNFIYWFCDNHEVSGESYALLETIAESEELLSRLRITDDGSLLRPLLIISSTGTGMPSMLMQTFERNLRHPDEIRAYLDQTDDKPFYITFYFPNQSTCEPYQSVAENPPTLLEPEKASSLRMDFELAIWLEEYRKALRRREILSEIDGVLERGEKRKFFQLVRELKKI